MKTIIAFCLAIVVSALALGYAIREGMAKFMTALGGGE